MATQERHDVGRGPAPTPLAWAGAVALGGLLFATPFLRYSPLLNRGEAHANHEARHGGQLGMVGDHHVEVRRRGGRIDVFVSDALRAPLRAERLAVSFDGADPVVLPWVGHRFSGPDQPARDVEVRVTVAGGAELATTFDFSESVE